jgi:hypothetical protein
MDFQAKAQMAVTSAISMSPSEALGQSLINDQPKIDSAVKSFMSLCAARSLVASDSDVPLPNSNENSKSIQEENFGDDSHPTVNTPCIFTKSKNPRQAALLCARELLKAINVPCSIKSSDKINIQKDASLLEKEVVRIVWDGLLKNGQKPSKCLGRKALSYAFPSILKNLCDTFLTEEHNHGKMTEIESKGVDSGEAKLFFKEFGYLLFEKERSNAVSESDSDACLLWDEDRGKAELDRRRKRREESATSNVTSSDSKGETDSAETEGVSEGLTIEELPDNYQDSTLR